MPPMQLHADMCTVTQSKSACNVWCNARGQTYLSMPYKNIARDRTTSVFSAAQRITYSKASEPTTSHYVYCYTKGNSM